MRLRSARDRRERRDEDLEEEGAIEDFPGDDAELAAEIDRLTELNRANPSVEQERMLLHLRNLLGIRLLDRGAEDGGFPEPDYSALPSNGLPLPEIESRALTPELLRAAILRGGCALVRGLIEPGQAEQLAHQIDQS